MRREYEINYYRIVVGNYKCIKKFVISLHLQPRERLLSNRSLFMVDLITFLRLNRRLSKYSLRKSIDCLHTRSQKPFLFPPLEQYYLTFSSLAHLSSCFWKPFTLFFRFGIRINDVLLRTKALIHSKIYFYIFQKRIKGEMEMPLPPSIFY